MANISLYIWNVHIVNGLENIYFLLLFIKVCKDCKLLPLHWKVHCHCIPKENNIYKKKKIRAKGVNVSPAPVWIRPILWAATPAPGELCLTSHHLECTTVCVAQICSGYDTIVNVHIIAHEIIHSDHLNYVSRTISMNCPLMISRRLSLNLQRKDSVNMIHFFSLTYFSFPLPGCTFLGSHPDQCPCQTTQTGSPDQEVVLKSPIL